MIFRIEKTKDYTVMSNYHLRDKNISLKAKGLLSWMLSNNDDWDYSIAGIVANCKENETAIKTALKELQQNGYIRINKQVPNTTNNRIHYIYNVYEKPQSQDLDFLGVESLAAENPGQINTNIRNTKNNKQVFISKDINTTDFFGSSKKKSTNNSLYSKCINMIDMFIQKYNLEEQVRKHLIEYLNFRLEVKDKPLYSNMWKGMINKLEKLYNEGQDVSEVIQYCIERGYLSFYAPYENSKQKQPWNEGVDISRVTEEDLKRNEEWEREMISQGKQVLF